MADNENILYCATKVDKGVVLGVAQILGTEYFPAACVRGASFFDPVAGEQRLTTTKQSFRSALGVKVRLRSQTATSGESSPQMT